MKGEQLPNQACHLLAPGGTPSGYPAGTEGCAPFKGRLNPCLPRWLQGLPLAWDLCARALWGYHGLFSARGGDPQPQA
jgi:hypothetical protein